jgi:hypothetical protein
MLAEWANRGLNQWTIKEVDITMVKDTSTYNIDSTNATAPIDVLDAYIRETINNETTDFPLNKISRAEYANLSVKTTSGKPNQVFVNKQTTPTITVWPVPDKNSTYTVRLNVLTRMDDVDGAVDTVDMPFRFFPCFVAGLAYYISMKKAPERTGMLKQVYEEEFTRALSQDEPRTSLRITPSLNRYNSA